MILSSKQIISGVHDAMQKSIRTGQPYQTRLDPPPGPPPTSTEISSLFLIGNQANPARLIGHSISILQ